MERHRSLQHKREVNRVLDIIDPLGEDKDLSRKEIRQKLGLKAQKIGEESEERARSVIELLEIVKNVEASTEEEDKNLQVDLWVEFHDQTRHQRVGIQVKSSFDELSIFYNRRHKVKRLIGICAGPSTSERSIQNSFLKRLRGLDGFI